MVYRKGNGDPYTMIKSLTDSSATTFTNSVTSGVKYTYKVSAYKMDGKKKSKMELAPMMNQATHL